MEEELKPECEEKIEEEEDSVFKETFDNELEGKLTALGEKEVKLKRRIDELSSSFLSEEVVQAKIAVLQRKIEDALDQGKPVQKLKNELSEVRGQHARVVDEIKKLSAEVDSIQNEKLQVVMEFLRNVQPVIKQAFVERLDDALDWIQNEFELCQALVSEYGIAERMAQRNPSFFRGDFKIFREKPWEETRNRLDEWLL